MTLSSFIWSVAACCAATTSNLNMARSSYPSPYNLSISTSATRRCKRRSIEDDWASLHRDTSRAFDKPESGRFAVKVINHLGDEVMKVFRVTP
jgi:hypothetical protein